MIAQKLVADAIEFVCGDSGATLRPTSARAWAPSRPATRISSIVSASLTSGPTYGVTRDLPTYSGRAIDAGTVRIGLTVPG